MSPTGSCLGDAACARGEHLQHLFPHDGLPDGVQAWSLVR